MQGYSNRNFRRPCARYQTPLQGFEWMDNEGTTAFVVYRSCCGCTWASDQPPSVWLMVQKRAIRGCERVIYGTARSIFSGRTLYKDLYPPPPPCHVCALRRLASTLLVATAVAPAPVARRGKNCQRRSTTRGGQSRRSMSAGVSGFLVSGENRRLCH